MAAAAHRRRWVALVASAALLSGLVAGCGAESRRVGSTAVGPTGVPAATSAAPSQVAGAARAPALVDAPLPVRVRVPRLGIDAALDPLHLDSARVLVPPAYGRAGWYAAGPEPGEMGRAVIAGHVDSKTGPDTFAGLYRARAGDTILVRLADGSTLRFLVQRVRAYPRDAFPTDLVYGGPQRRAELRMITCTGPYDRSRGGYQDNLIVFARLAG